jgi:hypothetical protein
MNRLNRIVRKLREGSTMRGVNSAMALAVVFAICPTSAFSETHVRGNPEAVLLETNNSSIEEVLTALGNSFGLHYQSPAKLEKQISGSYEGSLKRVLARILEGNDFVLKTIDGQVHVTVLASRQPTVRAATSSSTPAGLKDATTPPSPPSPPALASAPTRVAEVSMPVALVTPPPSLESKDAEPMLVSAPLPRPYSVAEGPVPAPSPGLSAPMPVTTPSNVAPPMLSATTARPPEPAPTSVLPPGPPPATAGEKTQPSRQ